MELQRTLLIKGTKDYSIFKTLSGNRTKNIPQVKRLSKLIETAPNFTYLSPILVNQKMEVIDGQHRIEAYLQHGEETGEYLTVYYIVRDGFGLTEARALNAGSKPWLPKDYAKAYVEGGNPQYQTYLNFIEKTGLNHDIIARYLSPMGYSMQVFREGKFVVENEALSKRWVKQLEDVADTIRDSMAPPAIDCRHRSFAIALLELMRSDKYDHLRMLEQLEEYSRVLRQIPMKNRDLAVALQSIYNKGREDKVLLID